MQSCEIAGHALLTRQMGGKNPCPLTDPTSGFNDLLAVAFKLNGTVEEAFGKAFGASPTFFNVITSAPLAPAKAIVELVQCEVF